MEHIYSDIATRTGGNIYLGVVGPVRTGKSTLIKRIMEELVIPQIDDPYRKERARDELPQSGSGKTIMTSEPKFVPEEAVEISPDGTTVMRVRMIDSVGYMVNGAVGAEENGVPRMVATPWCDHELPMTEAAELGTRKVMEEHCSIGLVVTTDGTVTDIPRDDYLVAEKRAITDMKATNKPFVVIINSREPGGAAAKETAQYIQQSFGLEPIVADCQALGEAEVAQILRQLLYAFPMQEMRIFLPRWMDCIEPTHPLKASLIRVLKQCAEEITCLGQAQSALQPIRELDHVSDAVIKNVDLARGSIFCVITSPDSLFYEFLSAKTGMEIQNQSQLLNILIELSQIRAEYNKISDALSSVKATGYGIVMPSADEMTLQPPDMVRKGGAFGIKLKASAPSIHMIRVDIDTQISPMVGGEQQSQDLISYLSAEEPDKLWQSNIFGKSVYDLVREGLTGKLLRTPDDVRTKFRSSLTRIVNEGATGLICLIL